MKYKYFSKYRSRPFPFYIYVSRIKVYKTYTRVTELKSTRFAYETRVQFESTLSKVPFSIFFSGKKSKLREQRA